VAVAVALALGGASCSSGESEAATTTTSVATAIAGSTSSTSSGSSADPTPTVAMNEQQAAEAMCRTLDRLSSDGLTPGQAAASIAATDLARLTPSGMADYGALLISAPRQQCVRHIEYADDIAYWLGI